MITDERFAKSDPAGLLLSTVGPHSNEQDFQSAAISDFRPTHPQDALREDEREGNPPRSHGSSEHFYSTLGVPMVFMICHRMPPEVR